MLLAPFASLTLALVVAQSDPFLAGVFKPADVTVPANVRTKVVPSFVGGKVNGSEGQIRVEVVIDAKGSVKAARIAQPSAGSREYDAETLKAIKDWKFTPARKDDKTVPMLATVVVDVRTRPLSRGGDNEIGLGARVSVEGADDEFLKGVSTTDDAGVAPLKRMRGVPPNYPVSAMQSGQGGEVLIEAVILPDGTVGRARVVHPVDIQLDKAALAAANQWIYEPPTKDGQPISLLTLIVMRFNMR